MIASLLSFLASSADMSVSVPDSTLSARRLISASLSLMLSCTAEADIAWWPKQVVISFQYTMRACLLHTCTASVRAAHLQQLCFSLKLLQVLLFSFCFQLNLHKSARWHACRLGTAACSAVLSVAALAGMRTFLRQQKEDEPAELGLDHRVQHQLPLQEFRLEECCYMCRNFMPLEKVSAPGLSWNKLWVETGHTDVKTNTPEDSNLARRKAVAITQEILCMWYAI